MLSGAEVFLTQLRAKIMKRNEHQPSLYIEKLIIDKDMMMLVLLFRKSISDLLFRLLQIPIKRFLKL